VDLLLEDLSRRLADRQLSMKLNDAAKQYLIDGGYDPVYGARPLKRFIQQKLETLLARKMIAEDLEPGTEIVIDYDGRGLKA
jgi:ATP-dependent Clp protease ATP-binding subunit ClpB